MVKNWKRTFVVIYAGQAFSILGSAAVQFAIIWYLTVQTESAITLTTASIVSFLPTMFIGPFAGIWIDRYNRRTVMIAADGLVALSSAFLGIVFLLNNAPPVWLIYIVLFVRGLGSTFHGPAMQAAIPMLVPSEMLTKAGGWGNLINSGGTMLGPVLGAALMGILPIASIMLVDILGAAFAIVCLLFVKIPDVPRSEEKPRPLADMKLGLSAVRQNRPLMAVFVPMVLVNVVYMPLGSLFPLFVLQHFGGTAWHNSVVELVFSAGLLVSSLVMGLWGGMKKRFLMVSVAVLVLGLVSGISGALPATVTGFVLFAVCSFLMGSTGTFINVPLMAYIQESTAPEVMGKVFALIMSAMTLAMPVGLLIAGPVSEVVGVDLWFIVSGIVMALTGILCWLMTRRFDKAAATAPIAGQPEAPVQPATSIETE